MFCSSVHVAHRPSDGDRKTGAFRLCAYETNLVAPEEQLTFARVSGEGHYHSQISAPSSTVVAGRRPCPPRPTTAPAPARPSNLYRRIKRRLGRSLRRLHRPRSLVRPRKSVAHKFSGIEGSAVSSQTIREIV